MYYDYKGRLNQEYMRTVHNNTGSVAVEHNLDERIAQLKKAIRLSYMTFICASSVKEQMEARAEYDKACAAVWDEGLGLVFFLQDW
jgi:hypothetical protein